MILLKRLLITVLLMSVLFLPARAQQKAEEGRTNTLADTPVTIQNWRIDYHVSFPYLRAKLKT
jgi:hypothetical protein